MLDLNRMRDEAYETSKSKGWYEKGRSDIPTLFSLIHSEISEALEAWRASGDEGISTDAAKVLRQWDETWDRKGPGGDKPEGVAAELADVVIRVGDMSGAYEIDLAAAVDLAPVPMGVAAELSFPARLAFLHSTISRALDNWAAVRNIDCIAVGLGELLLGVFAICDMYKIDLSAAVTAKMAFNKTRPHRHGGKKV